MKRKKLIKKYRIVKRCYDYDAVMLHVVKNLLNDYDKRINPRSITGYVVNQQRGHAYWYQSEFTVPLWAYKKGMEYFRYYVSHELSHIIGYRKFRSISHDKEFYEVFKRLCPKEIQHHEIGYLKKTAHNNGIWEKVE
jgi:predicted SprT family Zn-dependent metalloprotease